MEKWIRARYQPNLPLDGDRRVTASPEHIALSRRAAQEGAVLLKNNGELLPLALGTRVALFGKGSFDYVKGGGGSGDVTVAYVKNLYDGLKGEGVPLCEPLSDFYRDYVEKRYAAGDVPGLMAEPALPQTLVESAQEGADVAVIVLSRFSGEGWDREPVPFLSVYRMASSRTADLEEEGWTILREEENITYAARFHEDGWNCGLDEMDLLERFDTIRRSWYNE